MTIPNDNLQNGSLGDNSGTMNNDLGPRRWFRRKRSDVKIRTEQPYDSLDEAAMAAAKEIYDICERTNWDTEYGIVIHENKRTEECYLTSIIRGTRNRISFSHGIALGRGKYKYVADLHSHPVEPYIINEPSGIDYHQTLVCNVPRYVVVNVGANGILIKFTPPSNRSASSKGRDLFENKVRELRGIRRNGALPVGDELLNGIREIPRHTKIEFITEIIGKNDGQQKEEGQLQETPIGDNIRLEPLDPQTILWKTSVSDAEMVSDGYHDLWSRSDATNNSNLRYKERESTYDARRTVAKLNFPNEVPIIIEKAFVGFTAVKNIDIPSHVSEIGKDAFRDCIGLAPSITIPGNVTSIGDRTFSGCARLTFVTIENGVISIGERAFYGCTRLMTLTIGNSVESIGKYSFSGCTDLRFVTSLNPVPPAINRETFIGLPANATLYVPKDSIEIYRNVEYWKVFGQRIESL